MTGNNMDGAYRTGVGILAHQNAMESGATKMVPVYEDIYSAKREGL